MSFNSYKDDEQSTARSKAQTLKRLLGYLFVYKWQIVLVLAVMGYGVAVRLMNPLIMESSIDDYIGQNDFKGLYRLLVMALVMNLTLVATVKLRMYIMAKVCNQILLTIRQELYTHIQKLDFAFFDSRPTGKILSRIIGDINSLKDVLSNCVTTLVPDALKVIAVIVIMVCKNPALAFASLLTLPFMAAATFYIEYKAHPRWQLFRKKAANLNAFIHEDMAGIRIIQSFHAQKETEDTFDELLKEHRDAFFGAVRMSDAFGSVIDLSWGLGCIFLYFTGIVVLGVDAVSVGTFIAFGTYLNMFWQPIHNISNFYNQLVTNIAGAERIFEILDTEPGIADGSTAEQMPEITGEVVFDHVDFSYDDKVKVLDDVSFTITPGETIALVGPTGAGKTTIVNLISRFYEVTGGSVRIDGQDVRDVTIESLRKQMGIMTQDNFLFSGTIRENIRYGRLDATDEEVEQAARTASAHSFIVHLEHGYDTMLEGDGANLSQGQRQLINIARAAISKAPILILDEATSSVDTRTEKHIEKGMDRLMAERTTLVIAHRLSTVRNANAIMVLENGEIIERGDHDDLLLQKGRYYELYTGLSELD